MTTRSPASDGLRRGIVVVLVAAAWLVIAAFGAQRGDQSGGQPDSSSGQQNGPPGSAYAAALIDKITVGKAPLQSYLAVYPIAPGTILGGGTEALRVDTIAASTHDLQTIIPVILLVVLLVLVLLLLAIVAPLMLVIATVLSFAGVVLAATFAALNVIPLLFMVQIAFIVPVGVLLDTLVVRTLLVPALTIDLGRMTWWPSHLSKITPRHLRAEADA